MISYELNFHLEMCKKYNFLFLIWLLICKLLENII